MPGFAARILDQTVHGGIVSTGFPQVLIGGKPAARVTDMHTCPLVTVLVPHVGGPFILGSFTVWTGNMPQSRTMDPLICVGPPDMCVTGCWTVLVGDAGFSLTGLLGMSAALMGVIAGFFQKKYPRAEVQADGSVVTMYAPNVRVTGTPEEQARTCHQLDAIRDGPGGQKVFDDLAARPQPTTVKVIGDPAGMGALHPGQQSYENCAVQSSQQLIRQATGVNNDEATMEQIAKGPPPSGYTRKGGTPIGGEATILSNGGVPAHMAPGNTASVDQALANNQGVISGHDAGKLWNDPAYNGGGHAVVTTGALQDENGQTIAYTINDTGSNQQGRVIPHDEYAKTMDGGPIAVTDNPIR